MNAWKDKFESTPMTLCLHWKVVDSNPVWNSYVFSELFSQHIFILFQVEKHEKTDGWREKTKEWVFFIRTRQHVLKFIVKGLLRCLIVYFLDQAENLFWIQWNLTESFSWKADYKFRSHKRILIQHRMYVFKQTYLHKRFQTALIQEFHQEILGTVDWYPCRWRQREISS